MSKLDKEIHENWLFLSNFHAWISSDFWWGVWIRQRMDFIQFRLCLWLKESNKNAVTWWYRLELLTKQLLNHSKLIRVLNRIVLIIAILWMRLCLHCTSPSFVISKWSVYLNMTMFLMYLSLPVKSFEYETFTGKKIM